MRHPSQRVPLLAAALGFGGLLRPSSDRALWALWTWLPSEGLRSACAPGDN